MPRNLVLRAQNVKNDSECRLSAWKENVQNAKLRLSVFSPKELMMKRALGDRAGELF